MTNSIAINFPRYHVDFDLDHDARTWVPTASAPAYLLDEDTFPLIGRSDGHWYELYEDGTFAEFG
jgi:hypothetical protein